MLAEDAIGDRDIPGVKGEELTKVCFSLTSRDEGVGGRLGGTGVRERDVCLWRSSRRLTCGVCE